MTRQTVTGPFLRVGDREIAPVVRVSGLGAPGRPAAGFGARMIRSVPVAVIERRGERERRLAIPDPTGAAVRAMAAAGLAVWAALWLAGRRWSHGR